MRQAAPAASSVVPQDPVSPIQTSTQWIQHDTVDGQNPPPVDTASIPSFALFPIAFRMTSFSLNSLEIPKKNRTNLPLFLHQASTCLMASKVRGVRVRLLLSVVPSKSNATARHLPSVFMAPVRPFMASSHEMRIGPSRRGISTVFAFYEACFRAYYKNQVHDEARRVLQPGLNIPNLYSKKRNVHFWTKLPGFQPFFLNDLAVSSSRLRKLDVKLQIRLNNKLSRWQRFRDSFQKLLDSRASLEDRTLNCFAVIGFYLQVWHYTGWSMLMSMPACGSSTRNNVPTQHQQEKSWMLIWLRDMPQKPGVVSDPFACCA